MEQIINQIFEIERKSNELNLEQFQRNLNRIYHEFEELGYKIVNPLGQRYDERDVSVEATLTTTDAQIIQKVIKPAIFKSENGQFVLIQKAIVLVA